MTWWDALTAFQQGLAIASTLLITAGIVWRRMLVPLVDRQRAMPILLEIAEEFKPNEGRSLHDRISRIELQLTRIGDRLDDLNL